MQDKARLKYEKPVSIDMGRVAPILGDTCSVGNGAADCPAGMNNAVVAVCSSAGAGADNDCRTGSGAGTFCWPTGSSAKVYCLAGSGYGSAQPASMEMEGGSIDSGIDSGITPTGVEPSLGSPETSTEPEQPISPEYPAVPDSSGEPESP